MKYQDYHRSLLVIGLSLLIVAGLVLYVWLVAGAADATSVEPAEACMSSVVIGRDPQPVACVVYLPGVLR